MKQNQHDIDRTNEAVRRELNTPIVGGRRKLPFKQAKEPEIHIIDGGSLGTLEVPVYGGVLTGEAIAFTAMLRDETRSDYIKKVAGKTQEEIQVLSESGEIDTSLMAKVMAEFSAESATIILQYRLDPAWTMEDTMGLPVSVINQLSNLFQGEMTASQKPKDNAEGDQLDPQTTQQI